MSAPDATRHTPYVGASVLTQLSVPAAYTLLPPYFSVALVKFPYLGSWYPLYSSSYCSAQFPLVIL